MQEFKGGVSVEPYFWIAFTSVPEQQLELFADGSWRTERWHAAPPLPQKYLPIDLRTKKTRAIRRRLTPYQVRHRSRQSNPDMLAAHVAAFLKIWLSERGADWRVRRLLLRLLE